MKTKDLLKEFLEDYEEDINEEELPIAS